MSELFDRYLSQVELSPSASVGASNRPRLPGVSLHSEKQMIARIHRTPYAIGFSDFYSVRNGGVAFAALQNKAGACVLPSLTSLSAAARAASLDLQLQSELNAVNLSDPEAYPVTGFSGLIIPLYNKPDDHLVTTVDLLRYILTDGQKLASESGYVALPAQLVEQELKALGEIRNH